MNTDKLISNIEFGRKRQKELEHDERNKKEEERKKMLKTFREDVIKYLEKHSSLPDFDLSKFYISNSPCCVSNAMKFKNVQKFTNEEFEIAMKIVVNELNHDSTHKIACSVDKVDHDLCTKGAPDKVEVHFFIVGKDK